MVTAQKMKQLVVALAMLGSSQNVLAQTFQTWANAPPLGEFHQPGYPIAFVAAPVQACTSLPCSQGNQHHGTDVRSANNPRPGNHLFLMMNDGSVVKLFPLTVHASGSPALIDTPASQLHLGTVVEPNVSEDGRKLYFSYFHDAQTRGNHDRPPRYGADIYRIDLTSLLNGTVLNPAQLPVERLTRSNLNPLTLSANDWAQTAMNFQENSTLTLNDWSTVYLHPMEMRKEGQLKLVYVSDERRLRNSNSAEYVPHNFNLHIADVPPLLPSGASGFNPLTNRGQFQYFTTTSALSPAPLREGLAFSYQATTEDLRLWHIQRIDSAGRWGPLMGYGKADFLFHLGSFCVSSSDADAESPPNDTFIAALYYTGNNEGYGSLYRQDLSVAGLNTYPFQPGQGVEPQQLGQVKITPTVPDQDEPSPLVGGRHIGKFTSPRCGEPGELYFSYTPTSANTKAGNPLPTHHYRGLIAFRPDLEPFDPLQPFGSPNGMFKVVIETSNTHSLVWPTPILHWKYRSGERVQRSSPPIIAGPSAIPAGMPWAEVGTSALYNTDRRPFDCWLQVGGGQSNPFNPNKLQQTFQESVVAPTDGLTRVQDVQQPCLPLDPMRVLGVSVQITSNQTDPLISYSPGYETDLGSDSAATSSESGGKAGELVKLLGVYDVRPQGTITPGQQQPFLATIPAHVPFELHLLDRATGLKLLDVRSWHSLQARETRRDCGGCHNHQPGAAIPYTSTSPALDMVQGTPHLDYNATCSPISVSSTSPTVAIPEWQNDIWPGVQSYCSSCHSSGSSNVTTKAAWGYANELEAYRQLLRRGYAHSRIGALGSPAFWAAYGARADGRDNSHPHFAPNPSQNQWSYRYSSAHNPLNLCNGSNLNAARWVYKLGHWIDNHMPRNKPIPGLKNALHDFFHPTVDLAVITDATGCQPTRLRAGWWDDSGQLLSVSIRRLQDTSPFISWSNIANGSSRIDPAAQGITLAAGDILRVIAEDAARNRQIYEKSVRELMEECSRTLPLPKSVTEEGASAE